MNKNAAVQTINSLQNNMNIAVALLREKSRAVASAKQDYFACKDDYNKALLDKAYMEHQEAKRAVTKASSALRIFAYRQKPALTASGHVIRH